MPESILLLSGGIDSTAIAYQEDPDLAVCLDYGHAPADAEVSASEEICRDLGIPHEVLHIDADGLGTGSMTDNDQLDIASTPEWYPFRNQLLITISAIEAVQIGGDRLLIGSVESDREHADGTSEFVELMDELLRIQEGSLRLVAPAIEMTSIELVQKSGVPLAIIAWTHSCHTSSKPCGTCRGCKKRQRVLDSCF